MSDSWNYFQNGKAEGPVPQDELRRMLGSGLLSWDDLVWREGLADWTKASQFPELRAPFIALAEPAAPPRMAVPAMQPYQAMPQYQATMPRAAGLDEALEALRATKPWARFMGVLGFISFGFMVVGSIAIMGAGQFMPGFPSGARATLPLVYLAMAALQLPPAIFLNRYAGRIRTALDSRDPADLTAALQAQKSFWVYVGILTLVVVILYALIFLVMITVGIAAFSHRF